MFLCYLYYLKYYVTKYMFISIHFYPYPFKTFIVFIFYLVNIANIRVF